MLPDDPDTRQQKPRQKCRGFSLSLSSADKTCEGEAETADIIAMTNGVVRVINRQRGMVGIFSEYLGGYTIIELMGDDDIEEGDEIERKNDFGMAGQSYRNVTKGKTLTPSASKKSIEDRNA